MSGADDGEKGALEGAHTGENFAGAIDPARVVKVGATRATVEAAISDLAAGMADAPAAQQASLMLDEMDEQMALFAGPVRHVADTISEARRARGRPKGSQNKNSFGDTLMRMGFRHPGINLASLANADKHRLAVELAGLPDLPGATGTEMLQAYVTAGMLKRDQVIALIDKAVDLMTRANAELLPYFEGKPAQKLEMTGKVVGYMIFEDVPGAIGRDDDVLDLTSFPSPE